MRIVIALGGNALLRRAECPGPDVLRANALRVATALAPLAHEHDLVLTHPELPDAGGPLPPDLSVAQAQGVIGSLLARALRDALPGRRIAALVTHTLVRATGPASAPERILETATVRELLASGTLVICSGGGGIPVTAGGGLLEGTAPEADKDLAAALLAEDIGADFLLILTDVPHVYTGYGTRDQRPVLEATPAELRDGRYPADSMGPKAEAAARFVERTTGLAAIGCLDAAYQIVHGRSGTLVRPELSVG
ncbi:carbamate kinase [Streptomyces sp. NPDC127190]|uniref:amino acid kinase family protein n=1 Tax=unclassified Streptomyces TaxID=2593676 RepID=UPI00363F85BD